VKKKKNEEKYMKKNVKTAEGGRIDSFDSWERLYTWFYRLLQ